MDTDIDGDPPVKSLPRVSTSEENDYFSRQSCAYYRVAKTHRIPYLYRSFSAKEPFI